MIKTKNVYQPADVEDGFRLLIMRKWPRGVKKDSVEAWEKEFGPSLELLTDWRDGRISWEQFEQRYISQVQGKGDLVADLVDKAQNQTVTVLCSCREEERCHRILLKRVVEQGLKTKAG